MKRIGHAVQTKTRVNAAQSARHATLGENAVNVAQPPTLARTILEATGVDAARCYQCGKCTAGCPMARFMDLMPHQIMRLVQIGNAAAEEKLLACAALWSCAGCLTCTQRCPKDLDPAAVMDVLRQISYDRSKTSPEQKKVLAFHRAFLKTVESDGRMSEFSLVRRYKMASRDFMSDVALAPAMFARGKLKFAAHKSPGRKEVGKIFAACRKRGGA
jgi:heterodisulfide reductase subunit C